MGVWHGRENSTCDKTRKEESSSHGDDSRMPAWPPGPQSGFTSLTVSSKGQKVLYWPVQFSSVQSLSHVRLFATPWTAAGQASLPNMNSWSLLKLMSIESVMPSNHLILCRPPLLLPSILLNLLLPLIWSFQMSQFFASGGQSIGLSVSASVIPKNSQNWSPLEWTGWTS